MFLKDKGLFRFILLQLLDYCRLNTCFWSCTNIGLFSNLFNGFFNNKLLLIKIQHLSNRNEMYSINCITKD